MNNDLISREALKKAIGNSTVTIAGYEGAVFLFLDRTYDIIDNAPTVDLKDIYQEGHYDGHLEGYTKAINEKRPQGEWIIDGHHRRCNKCGEYFCIADSEGNEIPSNFCPNCGACMQKGGVVPERLKGECCGSCYLCDVGDCKADMQKGNTEETV